MTRFIVLTFGFLAWSFYEMSGGADYRPMVQASAATVTQDTEVEVASAPAAVSTRSSEEPVSNAAKFILASASDSTEAAPEVQTAAATAPMSDEEAVKAELASEKPAMLGNVEVEKTEAMAFTSTDAADDTRDLREVTGNGVNLRAGPGTGFDVATQLSKGTRVEVLDAPGNGWVYLRTVEGRQFEGWMADFLLRNAG